MIRRPPDMSWQARGLCVGDDPDVYDEIFGTEEARKVCQRCPVRLGCLEYALLTDERYGVWGGADPEERSKLSTFIGPLTAGEVADFFIEGDRAEADYG